MNEAVLSGFFRSRRGGQPSADGLEERMRSTRSARSPRRVSTPHLVRTPRRNRRGLVGILLSIIVVVAIIIAVFAIYNQVTAAVNAAQTAVFVRQLAPQISARYSGDYTGLNNPAAVSSGFIPDNWRNGRAITDPNGTRVTIGSVPGNQDFRITFHLGVPAQTCKAVLGALKSDRAFSSLRIGGKNWRRERIDTPPEIDTACSESNPGHSDFELRFR